MLCTDDAIFHQVEGGEATQIQHQTEEQGEITEEDEEVKPVASDSASDTLSEQIRAAATDDGHSQSTSQQTGSSMEHNPPPKTHSGNSLESVQSITHGKYFQKHNAPHLSGRIVCFFPHFL